MLLRSGRTAVNFAVEELQPLSLAKQLAMGLSSALLNPKNAIFYLTLMTVIIGESATLTQQAFAGVWMTFLVFFWDIAIAAIISHPKAQRVLEKRIPRIECVAGSILILFAGCIAVRFVR